MAVQMVRPTKHPKSGTYRVRLMIPSHLADTAQRLGGGRTELVESLGTKDPKEARRLCDPAVRRLEARLDAIKRADESNLPTPTDRDVAAMTGEAYRWRIGAQGDNAGTVAEWRLHRDLISDQIDPPDHTGHRDVTPSHRDRSEALEMLNSGGWSADLHNVKRVAIGVTEARARFADAMLKRASGDWTADRTADRFPPLTPAVPVAPPVALTTDRLLDGWAKDRGWKLDMKPVPRALYDRVRTLDRLAQFLGHRDATIVTKADAVRWKEDMQDRGKMIPTIRNDLSEMSAMWKHGVRQGQLPENPFDGISPPKPKGQKSGRRAFTEQEAIQILTAARTNNGYMRWLPWLSCLTGGRITELCQGTREDVSEIDGVWVLRIHDDGTDDNGAIQSVKNDDSRRTIPLHPALIAEGFLTYVQALPPRSPLFPDAKPDKLFGLRSTNAGKKVSRWLKVNLKITDPKISPNHSWRHWFVGACRAVQMHPEVRSALTGHSAAMDESANYGAGMGTFIQILAENIAKVRPPVVGGLSEPLAQANSPRTTP